MQRQVTKRQVQVIQPTVKMGFMSSAPAQIVKQRVAAYARVSTEHEEQQNSYEAQVDHYTKEIKRHSEWIFVEVYTEMLTTTLIQMHPTCTQTAPRAESWVHLSHLH